MKKEKRLLNVKIKFENGINEMETTSNEYKNRARSENKKQHGFNEAMNVCYVLELHVCRK